ncbi:MAG: efflux transporter, family, subunit [Gemmatimonadetes bacterium]|nr:efflux transporter, family, subunit [Gemmatimonadota bacterium]
MLPGTVVLVACRGTAPPPEKPPPVAVAVVTVTPSTVEEVPEFVGQVQPFRTVQVRAQASGVIVQRAFKEGAQVKARDILYRIDATSAQAAYRSAVGRMREAQASLSYADISARRLRPLLTIHAVAQTDVDNSESALLQARGALESARGDADALRKQLSETVVRAEGAGRVGRATLDVGARVTALADVLTTIDVVDPVYVSFRPSAEQLLHWKREPSLAGTTMPGGTARVQIVLADGTALPRTSQVGFVDPVVDPQTGTQEFRALFPTTDHLLVPGQFVRVRLRGLVRPDAIVIPQRAVLQQMGRQSVFVVDGSNKVASRDVTATAWTGANWLIEQGLTAGERVVVDGVQKIGPGAVVTPTPLVAPPAANTQRVSAGTTTP